MPVSYDKLWKMLIDRKMNRTELKDESLCKICITLGCDLGDIVELEKAEVQK